MVIRAKKLPKAQNSSVKSLRKNKPTTKILLLGSFPCRKHATDSRRAEVDALHTSIQPLADNQNIFYQDLRPLFLNKGGALSVLMSDDAIHINAQGKEAWMKAVLAFITK